MAKSEIYGRAKAELLSDARLGLAWYGIMPRWRGITRVTACHSADD
jgi:hypothetical protein